MAAEGNSDLPVPDLRSMEELCQPSLNGRGGPIAPIAIQATNFGLKNDMIQQSIKVNGVTDDAFRLYLFPHSLTHHATAWFDRGTFVKRRPEECYDLIENMTAHHNDWDTSAQRIESSNSITYSFDTEIAALKAEMAEINKNLRRVLQVNQQVKAVSPNCETCGVPHSFSDCLATVGNTQNVYAAGANQEVILRDGDERLTLNMRHDTSSYSNQPQKESINMINIYNSYEDYLKDLFATNHLSGNHTFSSHTDLTSPEVINPLSGGTTSSSPDHFIEEFADELALITFPPGNDVLPFDIKFDLREIECLLNHDPTKEIDSILEDSVDEDNLEDPNENLFDTIPEMLTDEHTLDYSSPPLYDDFDDDLVELESNNDDAYDNPFDSKDDKIKESKLLIDELDPLRSSDFLPSPEYDSFLFEDFSKVDALPSTDNEEKVFNPGILIHENLSEVIVQVTPDKNVKHISSYNASLILKDFNPPL
nr:hypothetical protein [Tanacetum cinerariifolium]